MINYLVKIILLRHLHDLKTQSYTLLILDSYTNKTLK